MRAVSLATMLACALAVPAGTALAEGPPLEIQKPGLGPGLAYDLLWAPDPAFPGYLNYDVVTGSIPLLRGTAGDFIVATTGCAVEDTPGLALLALPAPPLGAQVFYLVHAQAAPAACGFGSWNEAFAVPPFTQVGDRDPEVPAAPPSCPCP